MTIMLIVLTIKMVMAIVIEMAKVMSVTTKIMMTVVMMKVCKEGGK